MGSGGIDQMTPQGDSEDGHDGNDNDGGGDGGVYHNVQELIYQCSTTIITTTTVTTTLPAGAQCQPCDGILMTLIHINNIILVQIPHLYYERDKGKGKTHVSKQCMIMDPDHSYYYYYYYFYYYYTSNYYYDNYPLAKPIPFSPPPPL